MAQRQPEATTVQNGFSHSESLKKTELNNNHLPAKKAAGSPTSNLSKAKSEGNLSEEVENSPPTNFDDMPIKPAKGGQYFDVHILKHWECIALMNLKYNTLSKIKRWIVQ
ncbi:hypothetical protein ANCCAN_15024 [Ancylostoma caninum]|uniref:Uncharacterized protein n=1 Tax=Ancylostoma caninum TaxID=29170 RepID=A0A368G3N9_ANCCA|nr:hypothetical protein ANCCAN_15024 [Ancylostoma caninum]